MTELNFKGKEFVYNHHLAVPFRPLVPDAAKGIGPVDLAGNLIIHGDNLHGLKALLPTHAGKVDCIFIDPPYNTGNEGWAYNDNVNSPMIREWLAANPIGIEDGLRHDKWCAMMWPRLRLLHELLASNGSIWITLDDNEVAHSRLILDEIFGAENFVTCIAWQKIYTVKNSAKFFSGMHDYVIVYAKKKDDWVLNLIPRDEDSDYGNPDNDPRGMWATNAVQARNPYSEGKYEILSPKGVKFSPPNGTYWRVSEKTFKALDADNRIWWGATGDAIPRIKKFLAEAKDGIVPATLWFYGESGTNGSAKEHLRQIFSDAEELFITPKPVQLLRRILNIATGPESIILDSFAGSATTAQAVLEANKRDGGNRKFILVEMEDYADRLTAERVRRVINGYAFKGTQKTELLRESLNWRALQKAGDLVHKVEAIENLHSHEYDRIAKHVKDGELIVIGEKTVAERAEGLGGTFTYCTLGPSVELDKVLSGDTLPSYAALGAALFHMATSRAFDASAIEEQGYYLGESGDRHVWLIYRPDLDWLKSPEAALTLSRAKGFAAAKPGKPHLVFAPSRFVSQKMLTDSNLPVEFVPLPFALYRIERA